MSEPGSESLARQRPIGIFDSGVGGLTVLRVLLERLPHEQFVYLGDTARLPYGTKSPDTVQRYATHAARALVDRGIKLLVIACNTASAVAIEGLTRSFAPLPVVGVLGPGAHAAVTTSRTGGIAVLGTESTIRGGAYARAITSLRPGANVTGIACPLFVALAEEGWVHGEVPTAIARRYLQSWLTQPSGDRGDCILLGCTHFPVLRDTLAALVGPDVALVDSAETTADAVFTALNERGLVGQATYATSASEAGARAEGDRRVRLLATDGPERFARVGATFLGRPIAAADVELVDL